MFRIGITVLVVTAFLSSSGWNQVAARQGRALHVEDYYRVKTVSGTQISPDGEWVLFSVGTRIESDNSTRNEAHVVATSGTGSPWHIRHGEREVATARWTDDNWIEYSVGGERYKINPARPGEPQRVQGAPPEPAGEATGGRGGRGGRGGITNYPSPDGKWIVATREKPQPKPAPTYANDFEKRHQERFKGAMFDWKDFQRDGAPFPAPDPTAQPSLEILRMPAGGKDPTTLVDRDLRPANITWHPNGKSIAFTADPKWRDPLLYSRSDIWIATVEGASPRLTQLTDDGYNYSDLGFSPDGRWLAYARTFGTDMVIRQKLNHGGPRDLFIVEVPNSVPRATPSAAVGASRAVNLTADWDLEPGDSRWSPDSRYLYFTAPIGGESHLFRVNAPGGKVEQITKGPRRLGGLTFSKDMTKIAYTVSTQDAPEDVYVASIDGTNERRLTNVHREITSEIAFSPSERLRWPSKDGTQIEGWIMFPYGYDAKKGPYPLVVVSHGGPHSATGYTFSFRNHHFAAHGYFVLDTNFRSSTGYGEKFKWATWGAWGDKDGEDVISGIDYVLKRFPIDPKRVGHTGHSYGGFMSNWLITQYPDRFAAAISGAGISNWISDYGTADIYRTKETEFFGTPWEKEARERMIRQSPITYAGRVKTPTLFVHGEVDQRVPYEEAEQMYFALRRRGVPAKMIQYQGQAHGISGHWNVVHRMLHELAWWEKYLKPGARAGTDAAR